MKIVFILAIAVANLVGLIVGFLFGYDYCQKMLISLSQMGDDDESRL